MVPWWNHCSGRNLTSDDYITSTKHMGLFGKMPLRSQLSDDLFKEYKDQRFEKFLNENSRWATQARIAEPMFRVSNPTYKSVNATLLKYDKPVPPMLDSDIVEKAFGDLLEFFHVLLNSCPVLPTEEVEYTPDTVPGFVFSKCFGCREKRECLAYLDYINLFWERAHLERYPVLFTQCGKVENLKKKKIDAQDIRGFTVAPFEFFVAKARMSQALNHAMCEPKFFANSPIKHGINMMDGGFFDLLKKLSSIPNPIFGEGDAMKWDSSSTRFMLELCKRLRYHCWDKKGMSEEEWWSRMDYYYDQVISSYIILPTGQILQKNQGQPSGTTNTTDDNCIMHLFMWCYMWRKLRGQSLYKSFGRDVYLALYADDHIFSVNKDLGVHPYEVRKPVYEAFGVGLDPDKDLVTSDLSDHTFLGFKARWVPEYKNYVPIFDSLKATNALMKNEKKKVDVDAIWSRAFSIGLITCYEPEMYNMVRSYLEFLKRTEPTLNGKYVPTIHDYRRKWHRREMLHCGPWRRLDENISIYTDIFEFTMSQVTITTKKQNNGRSRQNKTPNNSNVSVQVQSKPRKPRNKTKAVRNARNAPSNQNANKQLATFNARRDAFINNVSRSPAVYNDRAMFQHYLSCLMKNWEKEFRYPDSQPRKTALFTSVSSFNVPLHQETSGEYRFSMAVQPQMGDLTAPSNYQAAVANPPSGASGDYDVVDWSLPTNYLQATNGRDPRIDINSPYLAQSVVSGFHGRTQLTAIGAAQAQPPINVATGQNFQGPNLVPAPTSYSTTTDVGFLGIVQNPDGSITVPAGSYFMCAAATFTCGAAGGLTITSIQMNNPQAFQNSPTATAVEINRFSAGSTAFGVADTCASNFSFIARSPTRLYFNIMKQVAGVSTPLAAGDLSALVTDLYIIPTIFTTPGPSNGAISLIRPVAQTILVTYMGPTLLNGGRIVGCYVPKGSLETNYFTAAAQTQGNYQRAEDLANLSESFDGQLRDGTFGFWTPYDDSDVEFRTVADMNAATWPAMVVSGVFNPVQALSGPISDIVRVRLVTTFEMITKSTAFDQQVVSGSQNIIDQVNRAIGSTPHFMANAEHLSFIKRFLDGVLKYGPLALKGASLAASLL